MFSGSWSDRLGHFLSMVKFSHTVFAFPFALMGVVLASLETGAPPGVGQLFWICIAMVGARSCAMGLNRVLDARFDAQNPRTASREIPAGVISVKEGWLFTLGSGLVFLFAAWMLNPLCLKIAPFILGLFVLYTLAKRFTALAHVILGICLGLAPIAAWIALRGDLGWPVVALGLAVLFWVAGFDIFFALQDRDFDASAGLHSIPVKLGPEKSIQLVRVFHGLMIFLLWLVGMGTALGGIYYLGVLVVIGLLVYEHSLVKPNDYSKMDKAFFNMNGYISVTIFAFTLIDALI